MIQLTNCRFVESSRTRSRWETHRRVWMLMPRWQVFVSGVVLGLPIFSMTTILIRAALGLEP